MAISASIKTLLKGEQVAGSKMSSQLTDELMAEGLLSVVARGSRKSYRARDTEALRRYLIDKDESYRVLEIDAPDSRASMARDTGSSKLAVVRSCPGFPINCYEPIACRLNGSPWMVDPLEGSFLFVADWKTFVIPEDVIVVGIENMENFRKIRQQRALLSSELGLHRLLFVSRYPQSTDLRSWLCSIPNHYIHFGDFDLAGISIFLTEFHAHLGERSSFLIPKDIEQRLANNGTEQRYNAQYQKFKNLATHIPALQNLIDAINKYRRGYDQEGYISI
jgi:hypothetical protein